jgi:hypothetical protein
MRGPLWKGAFPWVAALVGLVAVLWAGGMLPHSSGRHGSLPVRPSGMEGASAASQGSQMMAEGILPVASPALRPPLDVVPDTPVETATFALG